MTTSSVALDDVQGFIVRTYAMPALRVFALKVEHPALAGRLLGALVSGDASLPQLTTAAPWATKPDVCEISWLVVIECSPKLPPRPHGSRNDRECRSPHRRIGC